MTLMRELPGEFSGAVPAMVTRVVAGVDDSPSGLAALAAAAQLALSSHAQLVAVRAWALGLPRHGGRRLRRLSHPHVVLSFSGAEECAAASVLTRKALSTAVGRMPADVRVRIVTPEGDPALALIRLADGPGDVIVVGAGCGQLVRHLIHGSVSRYCVRHAACPVLTVPAVRA